MASKVNTKFVIILIAGLVAVCLGLAVLAYRQHMLSGERLIAKGDELMAAGEYKLAADKYSRGVNKDQGELEWLEKWRSALTKTTPSTQSEYNEAYNRQYLGILNKIAVLRATDPEYQLPLIEEFDRRARLMPGGRSVAAIQSQIDMIDERLKRLDAENTDNPLTKKIVGYRGIAGFQEMLQFPVDQAKRERVLKELEIGASVAGDDPRFALAIVDWHEREIFRLEREENRPAEAEAVRVSLVPIRAQLIEKFGDRPSVIVHEFRSNAQKATMAARTPEALRAALRALQPPAADLLATLSQIPVDQLSEEDFLDGLSAVAEYADRSTAPDLAAWAEKYLAANPTLPRTLIATARLQRSAKNIDRSFELFDKCVLLPDVPVSLEGLVLPAYRRLAAGERVDTALIQREEAKEIADQERYLEIAKKQRDELKKLVDVGSEWELDLREARIAMVEQNYRKAIALFDKLRSQGQADNPQILGPLADALAKSGSEGMARTIYERMLANGQDTLSVLARLADIEIGLNNLPRAKDLLERAQRIDPTNEFVQTRLANITTVMEQGDVAAASAASPLVTIMLKAKRAREDGNIALARTLLREALDLAPGDVRVVRYAVQVELSASDRPAALAIVDEALTAAPSNKELRALRTTVEIEDPVKAAEQIIADSTDPEVVKALSLYVIYAQNEMIDKANAAFASAEKLDPNYPAVIEIGFNRALRENEKDNFAKATEYAERAARLDVDQRAGLTYQGRLELAKGDAKTAEQTLQRAVQKMEFDPNVWRWLGMSQRATGKVDQALTSYERAYNGDPRDPTIAAEFALLLNAVGQGDRALAVMSPETGVLRFDDRNQRLINLWLELEAAHGDRSKAIEARKRVFDSNPADADNTRQYLALLVQDKELVEAAKVVDAMEELDEFQPLEVVAGRAQLLASNDEFEQARAMLLEYANAIPEAERTDKPYMLIGAFEREYGDKEHPESALVAFNAGRAYQDPVRRDLDRASGDLLFSLGDRATAKLNAARAAAEAEDATDEDRANVVALEAAVKDYYSQAEAMYAAVSNADAKAIDVKKRHAETFIRLERFDEAFAVLKSISDPDDMQVLLLQETLATRKGDRRAAQAAIDRAVEMHPGHPLPFYRRALLNRTDPARALDVMNDLDQAVRLNPGFIEAWQLRVAVFAADGRTDQAIAELGRAVAANPNNDELILYYIRVLNGSGRGDEAKKQAFAVANARGDDVLWLRRAAVMAYDLGDFQQAEALYKQIYDIEGGSGPAMDLLNCYIRRTNPPPTRAEVNRILPIIMADEKSLTPGGMMLVSRAREFLGERAEAEKWTVAGYEAAKHNPLAVRLWFENVVLRFDNDREKAFEYLLKKREYQPLPASLQLIVLRREVTNGKSIESGLESLKELAPVCETNDYTKVEMLRLRNMFHYSLGQYEEAAEDCRQGLAIRPRDLEFNNNIAYILAKHLDDAKSAVKHAELAATLAPRDPAVLDTLGWVYFKVGQFRDADREFARSVQVSVTPDDFVPTYLHQAQSKQAIGDLTESARFAKLAKANLDKASQQIKDLYAQEIQTLLDELSAGQ